jgi:hypothetical protein
MAGKPRHHPYQIRISSNTLRSGSSKQSAPVSPASASSFEKELQGRLGSAVAVSHGNGDPRPGVKPTMMEEIWGLHAWLGESRSTCQPVAVASRRESYRSMFLSPHLSAFLLLKREHGSRVSVR